MKTHYVIFHDGEYCSIEWGRLEGPMSDEEVKNWGLEHLKSGKFSSVDVYEYDSKETDEFKKMSEWSRVMTNNEGKFLYHIDNDNSK